jgi:hypothetical protein
VAPRNLPSPVFAQPEPTADPRIFTVKHPSDGPAYKLIDKLNEEHRLKAMPFPAPRASGPEPQLSLLHVLGNNQRAISTIAQRKQITSHSTGDCGSPPGAQDPK